MTPEEKIYALSIALQNSLTSIHHLRQETEKIMRHNPSYQKLLLIVEHFEKQAEQLLQDIQREGEQ